MNKRILSVSLMATLACAVYPIAAFAATGDYETSTVKVGFADLDINSSSGATTLYRRIERAADNVCGPRPDIRHLRLQPDWKACRDDAITNAVTEVGSPALAAVYSSKVGGTRVAESTTEGPVLR